MTDSNNGQIANVAFGGEGVIHTCEGVVFVHDTLPSELVSVEITQQKKRFSRGKLLRIESPHPLRILPKCELFSVCGGCQLQHADYSLQILLKQQWLQESLQRIGGISSIQVPSIEPAKQTWEYRRHITFHLKAGKTHYSAIFHGRDPSVSIEPLICPIFSDHTLAPLHEIVGKVPTEGSTSSDGRVQVMKNGEGKRLYTFHFKNSPRGAWEILQKLIEKDPLCVGVKLKTSSKTYTIGAEEGIIGIGGLQFAYSPEAFVQAHPDQSEAIYSKIIDHLPNKTARVLDLYGGIGVTACLIASRNIRVTSVELNRAAVKLAKRNFASNRLKNGEFWCGDVELYLKRSCLEQYDLIIANPPREGISPLALKQLAASKKDLMIISCMPTTLARDLKVLTQSGYKIEWIQGYDMFPQTTHFETVVLLTWNDLDIAD